MRRFVAVVALAVGGLFALAPAASAHALLRSSTPSSGATLTTAPSQVTIEFTEAPEPSLSTIHVLDTSGNSYEKGKPQPVPGDSHALRVTLKPLPKGVYTVGWRTVSRADGHVTGGSFAFGVGETPSATNTPKSIAPRSPPTSWLEVTGRFGLFIGLLGLVGGAWAGATLFERPPSAVKRFVLWSWLAGVAGLVVLAEAQNRASAAGISALLATPLGHALEWRGAALIGAGIVIVVAAKTKGDARRWLWATVAAGAGLAYAHVAAGHAEAAAPRLAEVAAQWVHVVAASAWVGGLAALLLGIRGVEAEPRAAAVKRFSTVAAFLLAIVAATGIVRAIGQLHRWSDLWDSGYGVAVDVKAALILVLAGLGAVNRYRNVPHAETSADGLRRVSHVEVSFMVVTLAVAALLASLAPPPPKAEASAAPAGVTVSGADFGTSVRVRLTVSPGTAGPNTFTLRLTDFDTGKPITDARVTLRFTFSDDPRVGQAQLLLARKGSVYEAQGFALSLSGRWSLSVLVERGTASLEIPLSFGTRCVQTPIAGTPTIWVVDLGGGVVAQGYVDPEKAGKTEVHITFFDAKGNELPVPSSPSWEGSSGSTLVNLVARRLSAGHFVADTTLAAGIWRFDFAGVAKDGSNLRGCFTETLR